MFSSRTSFLAKLSYNNTPEIEWIYPLEKLNDPRNTLSNNNKLFIGDFYTKPTTIGAQVIDNQYNTN